MTPRPKLRPPPRCTHRVLALLLPRRAPRRRVARRRALESGAPLPVHQLHAAAQPLRQREHVLGRVLFITAWGRRALGRQRGARAGHLLLQLRAQPRVEAQAAVYTPERAPDLGQRGLWQGCCCAQASRWHSTAKARGSLLRGAQQAAASACRAAPAAAHLPALPLQLPVVCADSSMARRELGVRSSAGLKLVSGRLQLQLHARPAAGARGRRRTILPKGPHHI
jgi:hypothetical protein